MMNASNESHIFNLKESSLNQIYRYPRMLKVTKKKTRKAQNKGLAGVGYVTFHIIIQEQTI